MVLEPHFSLNHGGEVCIGMTIGDMAHFRGPTEVFYVVLENKDAGVVQPSRFNRSFLLINLNSRDILLKEHWPFHG